jgi:hypothetical protein
MTPAQLAAIVARITALETEAQAMRLELARLQAARSSQEPAATKPATKKRSR